jgi:ubiquinone/menaquinone biosynthesis C-methylase UbiE
MDQFCPEKQHCDSTPPHPSAWGRCKRHRGLVPCWFLCTATLVAASTTARLGWAQTAVAPPTQDINAQFLDPDMKPEEWANRFEVESREVFASRADIVAVAAVKPGEIVADVGAGTGLFTALFAREVGPRGWIYAVDLAPKFIEYLATTLPEKGVENVTPVLCTATSANLPPASVDVVFVCDTYHHFEHPAETLASLRRALRPGGRLVIVDFEREEGVSREWVLDHVRAGKATVTAEIEAAGFRKTGEPDVKGLKENYVVVFAKK